MTRGLRHSAEWVMMSTPLTLETIRQAPKALLHDHLDGGLRPATVIEIAETVGYQDLPSTDPAELAAWFRTAAHSGSLVRYLEPFAHTVAVMQTPEALHRVAVECVEDLAADSVVYAEVRFAPELHLGGGSPTFLSDVELSDLLDMIKRHFNLTPGGEFSIEVDPRTVTPERLQHLYQLGFNRLSFGVQDFDPAVQAAVNAMDGAQSFECALPTTAKKL